MRSGRSPHSCSTTGLIEGRERCRGIWWDRRNNCLAEEGIDFAQDTQEGGADEFEFIPDSEENLVEDVISLECVPDSFAQEVEAMEGDNSLGTSLLISGGVEAQDVEGMEESGAGRETGDLMSGWVESQSSDVLCVKGASAIAMEYVLVVSFMEHF